MRTILCYGDSNTWGYTPGTKLRYAPYVRWTGVCQQNLGAEYRVIEEGVNGRTTIFDDPTNPFRNGAKSLGYILHAAKPIDLFVLALGTNDLKYTDAAGAAEGAGQLVEMIQNAQEQFPSSSPYFYADQPKILLISPIHIRRTAQIHVEGVELSELSGKSLELFHEFQRVANQKNVYLFDASSVASPSEVDGVHMNPDSHQALGAAIADVIKKIFK